MPPRSDPEPLPALVAELDGLEVAERRGSLSPVRQDEPMCEINADRVTILHSYRCAGFKHSVERQWLRARVVERLQRACSSLPRECGLAIFDAWRPLALQQELFEAQTAAPSFAEKAVAVAPATTDPLRPPPHLTGGAVDLTLSRRGRVVELGTGFDVFTPDTLTRAFEHRPGRVRELRRLLYHAMHGQGFVVLAEEWWHFEYGTRLWGAITSQPVAYGPANPQSTP